MKYPNSGLGAFLGISEFFVYLNRREVRLRTVSYICVDVVLWSSGQQ